MNNLLLSLRHAPIAWSRWFVVACILLAFARLVFDLDAKTMWWDESLSLQRAEQGWADLLKGKLVLRDGGQERVTWDQHPFAFFAFLGLVLRMAGDSVFFLRFISLLSATLLVPVVWCLARFLQHKALVPPHTPYWATALAAVNPFILWYGQEARPYALWMLVSLAAFWTLWEWLDTWSFRQGRFRHSSRWALAYGLCMLLALGTHFYAIMMIPIHGLFMAVYMVRFDRKLSIELMTFLLLLAGTLAFLVYQLIMTQPGAGGNYVHMGIGSIMREMLHAFGTGLSTRLELIGWLDIIFLALVACGLWYSLHSRENRMHRGWFLGAYLLLPVVALFALSVIQPNYMAARHHAQLIGIFLILVASGLAALSNFHLGAVLAGGALLFGVTFYSSYQYYLSPYFQKAPDYALVGRILEQKLREGDLVIFKGPNSWRLFRYYFPMAEIEAARARDLDVMWKGMPPLPEPGWFIPVEEQLAAVTEDYARVWMVDDRTLPYEDSRHQVLSWLRANLHSHREWEFFHPNASLALFLFLPEDPNPVAEIPGTADVAVGAVFGDSMRLLQMEVGERLWEASHVPLTLYWEFETVPEHPYRYIAWLVEERLDGTRTKLPHTEQTGTFRDLPQTPGQILMDYSHVEAPAPAAGESRYLLHIMIYDTGNLEKLAITDHAGFAQKDDEPALIIPIQFREAA